MTEKNRVNKKCYANRGGNKCRILVSNKCPGMKRSFFRTGEQHKESCERSKVRLQSLDTFEQQYIADKYYGGKIVWLEVGDEYDS